MATSGALVFAASGRTTHITTPVSISGFALYGEGEPKPSSILRYSIARKLRTGVLFLVLANIPRKLQKKTDKKRHRRATEYDIA
jgi:hypothetical protein